MKRWIWVIAAVIISTGVYFTIRYGLRPKPIPVLDPTQFSEVEQVGVVVYKRLRHDIRAERIVVLGTSQDIPEDYKIWSGFLKAAAFDKEKVVFLPHAGIPTVSDAPAWETLPYDDAAVQSGDLANRVKERIKAGQLIVIHDRTKEVSHLVSGSISRQMEKIAQHPVLAISSLKFALKQEEKEALQTQCLNEGEAGEARLACAAQRVARKYQRKAFDPSKIWAVMERHGLKEYLVFVNVP
jgi:hypothetical protein